MNRNKILQQQPVGVTVNGIMIKKSEKIEGPLSTWWLGAGRQCRSPVPATALATSAGDRRQHPVTAYPALKNVAGCWSPVTPALAQTHLPLMGINLICDLMQKQKETDQLKTEEMPIRSRGKRRRRRSRGTRMGPYQCLTQSRTPSRSRKSRCSK